MKLKHTLVSTILVAGLTACGQSPASTSNGSGDTETDKQVRAAAFIDGYAEARLNADFQVDITSFEEVDGEYKVKGMLSPGVRAEGPISFTATLHEQMGSLTVVDFSQN